MKPQLSVDAKAVQVIRRRYALALFLLWLGLNTLFTIQDIRRGHQFETVLTERILIGTISAGFFLWAYVAGKKKLVPSSTFSSPPWHLVDVTGIGKLFIVISIFLGLTAIINDHSASRLSLSLCSLFGGIGLQSKKEWGRRVFVVSAVIGALVYVLVPRVSSMLEVIGRGAVGLLIILATVYMFSRQGIKAQFKRS